MPLTDPLQTIVSILKNGSTGIGTSGYEIYKDDGVTSCNILVTYDLSKEELANLFGSEQDYDVIITCKAQPSRVEWIGFSTTMQITRVTLTVHVIEKHSAVGSGNKIITPELVRWKAKEALMAFTKAHVSSPGGSIHVWKTLTDNPEEDASFRPVVYKHVIETESWSYR